LNSAASHNSSVKTQKERLRLPKFAHAEREKSLSLLAGRVLSEHRLEHTSRKTKAEEQKKKIASSGHLLSVCAQLAAAAPPTFFSLKHFSRSFNISSRRRWCGRD
jgi:hypothetical protein